MIEQSSAGRIEQWKGFILFCSFTSPRGNFFFWLSNPCSSDLVSLSWESTKAFQQVNHREQAWDDFFNLLGKGGKWDAVWSSLVYCSSTFQALTQQHLRCWCQSSLQLHFALDVLLLLGTAVSWTVLPCRKEWTGPPHHDWCPCWASPHTGKQDRLCPLTSQPVTW